jgi:hypothetical protein
MYHTNSYYHLSTYNYEPINRFNVPPHYFQYPYQPFQGPPQVSTSPYTQVQPYDAQPQSYYQNMIPPTTYYGQAPYYQQSAPFQPLLSSFKKQDGTYDVDKMMTTAHGMMKTIQTAGPVIKQLGSIFGAIK